MAKEASPEPGKLISLPTGPVYFGPFRFDARLGLLHRGGEEIYLPPRAAGVLRCLLEQPGEVVAKQVLLDGVWEDSFVSDTSLSEAVGVLRQALGDDPQNPTYIRTVHRRGYQFIGEVEGGTSTREEAARKEATGTTRAIPAHAPLWRRALPWGLAAVVVFAVFAIWEPWQSQEPERASPQFSPPVPLTTEVGYERYPALSPDGTQVAYIWDGAGGPRHLWVKPASGVGPAVQRTSGDRNEHDPAWSPEGDRIAFIRSPQGDSPREIRWVSAMGGPENLITIPSSRSGVGLDWSPDGRHLAFSESEAAGEPRGIFLYSFETGNSHQVTFPPTDDTNSYYDHKPVFSPDGERLAFFRMLSGSGGTGDLCVQRLNDGEPVGEPALLAAAGGHFVWGLDWTAEGEAVVYSHGPTELYSYLSIVPTHGGEPSRLLVGARARHLSIARQGNRLVYTEWQDDHNIWRIGGPTAEDVGTPVKMFSSNLDDWGPAYSPDGQQVAFISDRDGTWEVWTANADGSEQRRLTDLGHATLPQWHPTGYRIAFNSCSEGPCIVYAIDASGGFPHKLTDGEFEDSHPTYSTDGSWIYFQSARAGGGPWEVWKMASSGEGTAVQITAGRDLVPKYEAGRVYVWRGTTRSIWSVAPDGGDEMMVLDTAINWIDWQVWQGKIVYIPEIRTTTPVIEIFDIVNGQTRVHTTLELSPLAAAAGGGAYPFDGLAVSPDGQYILFSRLDTTGSDLWLVDGFQWE